MPQDHQPSFYEILHADLSSFGVHHHGFWWALYYLLTIPGYRTIFIFRTSSYLNKKGFVGLHISRLFWQLNVMLHACDIDPSAVIGQGLYMPHPMGIVIGITRIGKKAAIMQNSTIGVRHHVDEAPRLETNPRLGDNVVLSAGAVVLGAINIGDNVVIGANAVVLEDVPSDHNAVGVPARAIPRKKTLN